MTTAPPLKPARTSRLKIFALLTFLLFTGAAIGLGVEKRRRSLPLKDRHPIIPGVGRPFSYWGEYNSGIYTLLNVVLSPLIFPSRLDPTEVERIMDAAMAKYPVEAEELGFAEKEGDTHLWRLSLLEFMRDTNDLPYFTPLATMARMDSLTWAAKRNAALMKFVHDEKAIKEPMRELPQVILVGNFRTGTTLMQRLLAADPRAAGTPQWVLAGSGIDAVVNASEAKRQGKNMIQDMTDPNDAWSSFASEIASSFYLVHPMRWVDCLRYLLQRPRTTTD